MPGLDDDLDHPLPGGLLDARLVEGERLGDQLAVAIGGRGWRLARHGVVPIAKKTSDRAVVGRFYNLVAQRVISITRERDETWSEVLRQIDPDAMVLILPEGRMKRANGLDAQGKPMTVRGGIADIVETMGDGRMLLAYSGGLHHIQVPGQGLPRLFKTIQPQDNYDWAAATLSNAKKLDPEVRAALRIGCYQLQYLDRVPAHAAISESVFLDTLPKVDTGKSSHTSRRSGSLNLAISLSFKKETREGRSSCWPCRR